MPRMPFGKHKGKELSVIPEDYLLWLSEELTLREPLKTRVARELERRQRKENARHLDARAPEIIPAELKEVCDEVVKSGYRSLALRKHPDQGGRHDDMLLLNRAIEVLRRITK